MRADHRRALPGQPGTGAGRGDAGDRGQDPDRQAGRPQPAHDAEEARVAAGQHHRRDPAATASASRHNAGSTGPRVTVAQPGGTGTAARCRAAPTTSPAPASAPASAGCAGVPAASTPATVTTAPPTAGATGTTAGVASGRAPTTTGAGSGTARTTAAAKGGEEPGDAA